MKNEPINEPIKKMKKISSIQIDSIAIEWNVCGWNKICDWAIMIEIKIKIEIGLIQIELIESNWAELKCLNKFICLFMSWLIYSYIYTYIHTYI